MSSLSVAPTAAGQATTTWTIDPSHSTVAFAVKHLMISTVRGQFSRFAGSITLDEARPERSRVDIAIDADSIDTRAQQRDDHLRSPDFLDAGNHPQLTFTSRRVEGSPDGSFKVIGDLTIRGVTREVALDASFDGGTKDPWGGERKAFSARTKINRGDFGLLWNLALEAGGVVLGQDVNIEIDTEFVKAA